MERLIFNPEKLKLVEIDKVIPNSWNPKKKDTEEYKRIKLGIELKGLRLPIIVREMGTNFEIIDGEQRWEIAKELSFEKIWIYNEGNISNKEAKELTIWYEQQVPFDELMLAKLVTDLSVEFKDFELPYSTEQIEEFRKLVEFNWEDFEKTDQPKEEFITFTFNMIKEQADIVRQALDVVKYRKDITDERALELICADFLAGQDTKEEPEVS